MIHKLSSKQPPKAILAGEQLRALVTDLPEAMEGAIAGGNTPPKGSNLRMYVGLTPLQMPND